MISRTVVNKSSDVILKLYKSGPSTRGLLHTNVVFAIRKTRFWLKDCNIYIHPFHKDDSGVFEAAITKEFNFWDFGVWEKGRTEQIWLKFSNYSLQYPCYLFEFPPCIYKLTKHRPKLEVRRHFFTELLVNRWNSLDQCTLNASTVNAFKNGLQQLKQSRVGFFEEWSPPNPMATQVLLQDWCGHTR